MLLKRLFLLVWLLAALAMIAVGWQYHAPFSYEPVGPRAFPLLVLGMLVIGLIYLLIKPGHSEEEPIDGPTTLRVVLCVLVLLAFAMLFEPLGFIPSAAIAGIVMARLYGGRWLPSIIINGLLAIALYILFDRWLDVPLPLGILNGLEF
ncbi:tripartite tricarboxylate transporter TctB family protein [Pseudomonas oryzihabitans]|uniref:DUF1468 domain-containing protein n=1 Tax=Pseudomonas oryzihabitans TaxID=47885 RepID=A0A2Z5A4J2_9PSED|nr:tripartite tricarboxylate transporter TctB family protein [Pseudomonas oryzihabitans]AXA65708.1 hypothetical protein CE139_07740 [Pseudomonas oryzihabitans]